MIHTQDEQSLCRFLGTVEFRQDVLDEYRLRQGMFHADGNSGPLGSMALVEMLRYLGYGELPSERERKVIHWAEEPKDGSIAVEVEWQGKKVQGRFLGVVGAGSLVVRLPDDPVLREFAPYTVAYIGPVEERVEEKVPDGLEQVSAEERTASAKREAKKG